MREKSQVSEMCKSRLGGLLWLHLLLYLEVPRHIFFPFRMSCSLRIATHHKKRLKSFPRSHSFSKLFSLHRFQRWRRSDSLSKEFLENFCNFFCRIRFLGGETESGNKSSESWQPARGTIIIIVVVIVVVVVIVDVVVVVVVAVISGLVDTRAE